MCLSLSKSVGHNVPIYKGESKLFAAVNIGLPKGRPCESICPLKITKADVLEPAQPELISDLLQVRFVIG